MNHAVLAHVKPEQIEVEIWRADELEMHRGLSSELNEMWSDVGKQANPRWLWHAIDHRTGEELGRPIAFVELAWQELIPALKGDRIDVIMSGISVTPVRQHRVRFVEPYLRVGQMAITRRLMLDSRVVDMRML